MLSSRRSTCPSVAKLPALTPRKVVDIAEGFEGTKEAFKETQQTETAAYLTKAEVRGS